MQIGLGISATHISWCICGRTTPRDFYIHKFEECEPSLEQLFEILPEYRYSVIVCDSDYLVREIRTNIKIGFTFKKPVIDIRSAGFSIGKTINEKHLTLSCSDELLKRVLEKDFLENDSFKVTAASEALKNGLGDLIYKCTIPPSTVCIAKVSNPQLERCLENFKSTQKTLGLQDTNRIRMLHYNGIISYHEMNRRLGL